MPAFAGSLQQVPLVDVLRSIEAQQMTGRLQLHYETLDADIYLAGGHWLLAERPGEALPLGALLVRAGYLTPGMFEYAVGVPFAEAHTVSDQQAARMLMSARVLNREQLSDWALQDAHDLLDHVWTLPGGEFRFDEHVAPPPYRFTVPIPVAEVLPLASPSTPLAPGFGMPAAMSTPNLQGAPSAQSIPGTAGMSTGEMGIRDMSQGFATALHPDALIVLPEIDRQATGAIKLTREQWRVLTMVDGQSSPRAIAANLQAPVSVIFRILNELLNNDIVLVAPTDE